MSMRNYPICDKGLILRAENLQEFCSYYKGGNEDLDDEYTLEIIENAKNGDLDIYELQESVLEILGFDLIGNLSDTEFYKLKDNINDKGMFQFINSDYLEDDEDIFISYLEKDTLFQKYENLEEIYNEVDNFLKRNGFEVSREFLENNIGLISGVSFG